MKRKGIHHYINNSQKSERSHSIQKLKRSISDLKLHIIHVKPHAVLSQQNCLSLLVEKIVLLTNKFNLLMLVKVPSILPPTSIYNTITNDSLTSLTLELTNFRTSKILSFSALH